MARTCSEADSSLPLYRVESSILQNRTAAASQLAWNISPRYSAYTPQGGSPDLLNLATIGEVSVRYQQEQYRLLKVQYHTPIGYDFGVGNVMAEISMVLQTESGNILHWIIPVQRFGVGYSSNGVRTWLTGQVDAEFAVGSFVSMFPSASQFKFAQWTNCVRQNTGGGSRFVNYVTCYTLSPLRIALNARNPNGGFTFVGGVTTPLATSATVSDLSNGLVTVFSYSFTTSGTRKQKAKCYSVALDRALDENGNLEIDERTNQPVDPSLLRALQKKDVVMNLAELDDFKRQKEFENTVYFWIMIAIISVIGLSLVLAIIFFIWGKRPAVVADAMDAASAALGAGATGAAGAGMGAAAGTAATAAGALRGLTAKQKKAAAIAAVSAFMAAGSTPPPAASGATGST